LPGLPALRWIAGPVVVHVMRKEGFWWQQVQPSYGAGGLAPLARTLIPINRTQSPALP